MLGLYSIPSIIAYKGGRISFVNFEKSSDNFCKKKKKFKDQTYLMRTFVRTARKSWQRKMVETVEGCLTKGIKLMIVPSFFL